MSNPQPYRVLARKYRPQRFSELIGQDAMIRTLGNAIARDRLAHAFLMTGVRGVGKTSTARLIAKALNCIGPDGHGGPTIDPCGICEPCVAIAEGRHVDVVEMDAASNTGIDDIREIIDAVRYSAVSARYKIYIIDEVHMLSKQAFNGLLKTLEEPPPHVKFLFATTEVQKVPVTVLSRCQRFDLRRISADMLTAHFATIARAESVDVEPEALHLIARAAEGSVRDGLSILDQAIAHADLDKGDGAAGIVSAQAVRTMLGLSDRSALRDVFARLLDGDAPAVLAMLRDQVDLGIDPAGVLRGLLEIVHGVTLVKAGAAPDASQSAEERGAADGWATQLSFATLHRLWQLLLKGHGEVAHATDPHETADMALLRVIHASQLPDPETLLKRLETLTPVAAGATPPVAVLPQGPASYQALVHKVEASGKRVLAHRLQEEASIVRWAPPEIGLHLRRPFELRELAAVFREVTGTEWIVTSEDDPDARTLRELEVAAESAARDAVLADPIVVAAFAAFPGAELLPMAEQRSALQ
jgi:DNA polymerase III subunit gamma/tau